MAWLLLCLGKAISMENYNLEFYVDMEVTSVSSAIEIVPMLVNQYNPTSVVDIGCGTGAFAYEFFKLGIDDVIGYEGTWMRDKDTLLQKDKYVYSDLTKKIDVTRNFDLCLCLEVAEHLDFFAAQTLLDENQGKQIKHNFTIKHIMIDFNIIFIRNFRLSMFKDKKLIFFNQ